LDTKTLKNEYRDGLEKEEVMAEKPAVEVENVVRYLNDVAAALSHVVSGVQKTISQLNHQVYTIKPNNEITDQEGENNDD